MNLKSVFCVFLVMFLLVSSSSVLGKESNEKNLNLFTKGIKEQVTLSGTIDPKQDKVELVEVHGKSVKGKFDVTSKNFNAVIKEEDSSKSYYLEGRMVLNNDSSLLYEGTVNSNKLFTFQAILSKAEENEDKYKASITLQKFKDEQKKEVTFGQTYSFNGKKASVKKFNQIRSKGFNSESTMFYISSNGDYYEFLGSVHGTYMNTAVWGPSEIGKGEADNHQLRSTTESSEVNEYWDQEEENMEPINTWVENYNVSISTSEPAVFNTVDPNDESTETWMVPVYLGRVIGVQLIPVETSSTSYDNNGTSNLEYEFTGLGYLDDSSVTSEAPSDNGFGVRYQMDLAQDISTGPKMMETESEFEYHTVMEWGNGVYIDKFLTVDNDLDYFISVVE